MSERAAIIVAAAAVARSVGSAVRGVSAHREMGGLIALAGGVSEMNLQHHSIGQEVVFFI